MTVIKKEDLFFFFNTFTILQSLEVILCTDMHIESEIYFQMYFSFLRNIWVDTLNERKHIEAQILPLILQKYISFSFIEYFHSLYCLITWFFFSFIKYNGFYHWFFSEIISNDKLKLRVTQWCWLFNFFFSPSCTDALSLNDKIYGEAYLFNKY